MPQVIKGPFYIDSYEIGADRHGGSPYADIVIGHPDGYRIVVSIRQPDNALDTASIHVELQ